MPRLSKAQKEARDERKTAVAAQQAADAQTTTDVPLGGSVDAPPPPAASALSTNQPPAAASTSNTPLEANGGSRRSPSLSIDLTTRQPSVSLRTGGRASRSKSPPAPPSEMSTSEGSGSDDDGKAKSITFDPEDGDGDDDDDGAGSNSGSSPEVRCMWEDCGQVFTSLAPFINHLHDDHVGIHKARYACEWTGCPRKGKMQTSRFALLSHLRSHTGEKPFTCPRPECDKSFTRSDALAKHMRVQHNINPVSTRGRGSRAAANDNVNNSGGRASRNRTGLEDDEDPLGEDSIDAVGDELLELAEGDNVHSLAEVENSLAFQGAKSSNFTYDNLFGSGARALDSYAGISILTDSDLGIVRDIEPPSGPLVDDDVLDTVAVKREEEEMSKVLEMGRREWIEREKKKRAQAAEADEEIMPVKRGVTDYDSDEGGAADLGIDDASTMLSKRPRRSHAHINSDSLISNQGIGAATRGAARNAEQGADIGRLKRLYLIEKAKMRIIQGENEKMRQYLLNLRDMEREEKLAKMQVLERALEAELGRDVTAIFSPPPSPSSHPRA